MSVIEAIILGIVQGLTEFLPVSSSGHLQIAKALLGVEIEENLMFDITLHAATVLSTIVILWPEIKRLICGVFSRTFNDEQAYILKLIISMIPIAIVGFALKDQLNAMLESPYILTIVGAMLLFTALLLAFAYYARPRQKESISYRDAFIIGLSQALAAMPGLSRSGTTIATGILLGNNKQMTRFIMQASSPALCTKFACLQMICDLICVPLHSIKIVFMPYHRGFHSPAIHQKMIVPGFCFQESFDVISAVVSSHRL